MCAFCHNAPETIIHIFCHYEKVKPIWGHLISLINDKFEPDCNWNDFDRFLVSILSHYYPIWSFAVNFIFTNVIFKIAPHTSLLFNPFLF